MLSINRIEDFWKGIAIGNQGVLKFGAGSDIVKIDFDADYNAVITMSDGFKYTITGVDLDDDDKITRIYITDGLESKYLDCKYDSSGYLIAVGTVEVADVQKLMIPDVSFTLQDKTVNTTTVVQTVLADDNYDGLRSVTINPPLIQNDHAPIKPSLENQIISPDEGYVGLSQIIVNAASLEVGKVVTPKLEDQTIVTEDDYMIGLFSVIVKAVELESLLEVTPTLEDQTFKKSESDAELGYYEVKVKAAPIQPRLSVTFSSTEQVIPAPEGCLGYGEVYVPAVPEPTGNVQDNKNYTPNGSTEEVIPDEGYDSLAKVTITGDEYLRQENIKMGVTIYGVEGSYEGGGEPTLQEKDNIQPGVNDTVVEPDAGYDGLSKVTVNGDSNLKAEYIKKDISIFGVTGTLDSENLRALDFLYTSKNNGFFNIAGWPSGYDTYWIRLNGNSADLICSNGLTWTFDGSYMRPNNTSTQVKWYKYSGNSSGWYFYQNDSGTWGCDTTGSKQLVWASVPIYYNGEIYLTPTYRPNVYIKE